jgi:hypothetical protein
MTGPPDATTRSPDRFRVERCRRCGHTVGEHKSSRSPVGHPLLFGICLRHGCSCTRFEPDNGSGDGE